VGPIGEAGLVFRSLNIFIGKNKVGKSYAALVVKAIFDVLSELSAFDYLPWRVSGGLGKAYIVEFERALDSYSEELGKLFGKRGSTEPERESMMSGIVDGLLKAYTDYLKGGLLEGSVEALPGYFDV